MDYVTIDVPTGIWWPMSNCAENVGAVEITEGDIIQVINSAIVQEVGWRAAYETGASGEDGEWPPDDHPLRIVLQREHWEWLLRVVEAAEQYEPELARNREWLAQALRST